MSQALTRKWRPARFDQVVGQEHITKTLQNSVAAGRIGHAYLFCGPRGTGQDDDGPPAGKSSQLPG